MGQISTEDAEKAEHAEFRAETQSSGDAGFLWNRQSLNLDSFHGICVSVCRVDGGRWTAIDCQSRFMRYSTAPLRRDFARCIEPDTGEPQAKSQGEGGRGEVFARRNLRPSRRMPPGGPSRSKRRRRIERMVVVRLRFCAGRWFLRTCARRKANQNGNHSCKQGSERQ